MFCLGSIDLNCRHFCKTLQVNESQKPPESRNAINEIYHTNHNIKTIKIVYNVSPMYVLEKALNYFRYKNTKLSFELVGISVNEPGEKFIYRCRANTFSGIWMLILHYFN